MAIIVRHDYNFPYIFQWNGLKYDVWKSVSVEYYGNKTICQTVKHIWKQCRSKMSILFYLIGVVPFPVSLTLFGTIFITTIIYLTTVLNGPCSIPKLHCKDSDLTKFILKKVQRLTSPYRYDNSLFLWKSSILVSALWSLHVHNYSDNPQKIVKMVFSFSSEILLYHCALA